MQKPAAGALFWYRRRGRLAPTRRQNSAAFNIVVNALREAGQGTSSGRGSFAL